MTQNTHQNVTVDKKDASVEIRGEVPAGVLSKHRKKAIEKLGKDVSIHGFRKGHAPEDIVEKQLGEARVLEEAANSALADAYPAIVAEHKLPVVGQPTVTVTKLAIGNPLGFVIQSSIIPEFSLPDYKMLAKDELSRHTESAEVSEKEFQDTLIHAKRHQKQFEEARKKEAEKEAGKDASLITPDNTLLGPDGKPLQQKNETQTSTTPTDKGTSTPADQKDEDLPELSDEFVRLLGDYKGVDDFTAELRDNLKRAKERQLVEKRRASVAERLVAETSITVPEALVEFELDKMLSQFIGNIEGMGMKKDQYLTQIKKTEEELRTEWKPDAEKRAKLELILAQIAKEESIAPDEKEIEREVTHLLEHHKDAEPKRTRAWVTHLLTNQKVLDFLESQGAS